jgi:phytoene dehydrogenase-like protein
MTAALLLARAGHRVTLLEARALGGLWASLLDADGYFLADNSCKVFQPKYVTTPALFESIGLDWRDHFTARHCLTRDWLRPMLRCECWVPRRGCSCRK